MHAPAAGELRIALDAGGESVSALLDLPPSAPPRAGWVLAHGAGAGMRHPFLAALAAGLAARGIAVLRYQFPAMEHGRRRVDVPAVAHAAVRAACARAQALHPEVAWCAGGKSFGARMTSQAQAQAPLPGIRGLAFAGFPLHPAGQPAVQRAAHLEGVALPMLFVQGTRDALADAALIAAEVGRLGARASLAWIDGADHAFRVRGRDAAAVNAALCAAIAPWLEARCA